MEPDAPAAEPNEAPPTASRRRRRWIWFGAPVVALAIAAVLLGPSLLAPAPAGGAGGALAIRASADPARGYVPLVVDLVATPSGGTAPYTVSWLVGGSEVASGAVATYRLGAPGNVTLTARVVDAAGSFATTTVGVAGVSPYPEAAAYIPADLTSRADQLAITWAASASVGGCLLGGWGTIDVPPYAGCAAAGGLARTGTNASAIFQTNPDDPEVTPALFQSTDPGVAITVRWWYNATGTVVATSSATVTTAVTPL